MALIRINRNISDHGARVSDYTAPFRDYSSSKAASDTPNAAAQVGGGTPAGPVTAVPLALVTADERKVQVQVHEEFR